ncbi:hypothetical protein CC86DRAFT_471587 [Ophiobolus disseminans]|uniref:Uncharacterized protein n=1 Tax=Ophiobolus disseminans TaxID=1469910 RepID=A0A6A6ZGR1_9PLEO|nr:hypothetical protein CC86DRAFT_471587 [Ophiobolus disseminans]
MAPTYITLTISSPATVGYRPIMPYSDDETAFANNLLCPRYAENDPTSAPPSPTLIETFDVLDSIPWRRSYIGLDDGVEAGLRQRLSRHWTRLAALSFMLIMLVLACGVSGYVAVKHAKDRSSKT